MQEVHADKVLMLAIGNNDYISYNKLFDRYYGRLCQYVYSLLMDCSRTFLEFMEK